jgi:hypothetical protein
VSVWVLALCAAVLAGLVALAWPLLRPREAWEGATTSELDALFDAKARALRALKDLDHEKEAGLLAEADWARVRAEHLAEAVRLNREIAAVTGVDPALAEERA